jgi:regulator of protease activity HflC (stomatin/prohibitin superfamily)
MEDFNIIGLIVQVVIGLTALRILFSWLRIFNEYERGVVFRLGKVQPRPLGPGIGIVVPLLDKMVKVDMRTVTLDVAPQDVITKDNITARVSAVVYYRVADPVKAVVSIENYAYATSQSAQSILRSIIGQFELDSVLSNRKAISEQLEVIIDDQTEPWGIKVINVDIKDVELPADMQRAIARQAEAERERRAKIIGADAEFQAAEKLCQAAQLMERYPMALQMRYLQTLAEISTENSSTVVFPVPIDILSAFKDFAVSHTANASLLPVIQSAPLQPKADNHEF